MVSLFHQAGFSLPVSTVLPSILFYMLIALLLFHWLMTYLQPIWAFAISLLTMCSAFMIFMARLSTPDCLSAFLLLSSFYFIIRKPSLPWMFSFLFASMFARLDNIIPALFIVSFLFFTAKWPKKMRLNIYLLLLAILVAGYLIITTTTLQPFNWNIFYYPTFAHYLDTNHIVHTYFSVKDYLALLFSEATTAIVFYHFTFFMLFLFLIIYSPSGKWPPFSFDQSFSILLVLIILFRFVLFPDLSDRFNISYYICFLILGIKRFTALLSLSRSLSQVEG